MYGTQPVDKSKPKLSESPPKHYLKKDDVHRMEDIKQKLGQSEEMLQIRNKYKGKNPSVQFLAKVPMYQRKNYLNSKGNIEFMKELESRREEIKDRAKPIDYDELKEHEKRVDLDHSERKMNRSAFTNRDAVNMDDSLAAIEEGTARKLIQDNRSEFLRRREVAKTITGLDKRVPAHLVHYKLELNAWAREHQRAKDLKAIRNEKGNKYGKDLKDKVLARREREKSAKGNEVKKSVTVRIENVSDLDKLSKSIGPGPVKMERSGSLGALVSPKAQRSHVAEVGNQYFSQTNRKYNSQNALKNLLGDKGLKQQTSPAHDFKISLLVEKRAQRAEQLALLYNNSPRSPNFTKDIEDISADQWTKAIETKISVLDKLESQMKSKGKQEPVKLPKVNPSSPKPTSKPGDSKPS